MLDCGTTATVDTCRNRKAATKAAHARAKKLGAPLLLKAGQSLAMQALQTGRVGECLHGGLPGVTAERHVHGPEGM